MHKSDDFYTFPSIRSFRNKPHFGWFLTLLTVLFLISFVLFRLPSTIIDDCYRYQVSNRTIERFALPPPSLSLSLSLTASPPLPLFLSLSLPPFLTLTFLSERGSRIDTLKQSKIHTPHLALVIAIIEQHFPQSLIYAQKCPDFPPFLSITLK